MALAIQYREGRQRRWQNGVTWNVSASGVLFYEAAGDRPLQPEAAIDMNLIIPSEITGYPATRVFCVGRVARIIEPDSFKRTCAAAATIVCYRLMRGDVRVN